MESWKKIRSHAWAASLLAVLPKHLYPFWEQRPRVSRKVSFQPRLIGSVAVRQIQYYYLTPLYISLEAYERLL